MIHDWEHQQLLNNPQRREEHGTNCGLQQHGGGVGNVECGKICEYQGVDR